MNLTLRPFSASDYPALTALYNRCRPDAPITEAFLRHFDATHEDDLLVNLLAERSGETGNLEVARRLVGAVWAFRDQPGEPQVHLDILLHPAEKASALAPALYGVALDALKPHPTTALLTRVRENWSYLLGFYEAEGFLELERMWEAHLDVQRFEPEAWVGVKEKALALGIELKTLAELPNDATTPRRLYTATTALLNDVPFREPRTLWPFERWYERVWQSPTFSPESQFLALYEGEIIGVSELRQGERPGYFHTGLTGVKRAYRRQGVARALKLQAAHYAKAQGGRVIVTQNHTTNHPMLGLNETLGFVRQPAWITLKKVL